MQTFNIVAATIWILFWLFLLIKGQSVMNLSPVKRTAVMLVFAAYTAAWILINHALS